MTDPSDEQLAEAIAYMSQYQEQSDELVEELLSACRVQDGVRGSMVTAAIHHSGDINLLMMVLGALSARIVIMEEQASTAHGPLMDAAELGINKNKGFVDVPWATSVLDQLKAAADAGDYHSFGEMAVDAHIKALVYDRNTYGEDQVDLQHVIQAMMLVDQQTVTVIAAEALLRLFKIYEGD